MTAVLETPALSALTDEELAGAWSAADVDDPAVFAAFTAEFDRRTRAERMTKARARLGEIRDEGWSAAYAQYLDAEAWTRGRLFSRKGMAADVTDMDLWTLPWDQAEPLASEELRDYWLFVAARITPAAYVRQRAAETRMARAEALDSKGDDTDEQDLHRIQRIGRPAELARDEARSLRRDETAAEAPEAGPGRAVDRGGPGDDHAEDDSEDTSTDGGAGGPVRPGRVGGNGDMGGNGNDGDGEDAEVIPLPVSGTTILNDLVAFSKTTVCMSDEMHDAAALAAMITHTPDSFTTLPRLAALSFEPQSGKSTLVNHFTMVVNNPWDPDPTSYALRAKFTERERPTPVFEEIHEYYGRGGNRSGNKDLNKILKMGYQRNAKLSRSVNGVSEDVSCFCVAILAGLRNAVPDEIYQRCIVWKMTGVGPGVKLRDNLDDDVQALGMIHGVRMHQWAKNNAAEVKHAFRNLRRIHPMLFSRLKQIWGPLFAVAQVAGEDWPARCLRAFKVMALDASDQPVLSPEQMILRDAAAYFAETGEPKAFAASIREHMTDLDEPLYDKLSERGMALLMTDALGPAQSMTIGNARAKGYHARPVLAAWKRLEAQLEPIADDEPEGDEFDSLFDVETVTEVTEVTEKIGGVW